MLSFFSSILVLLLTAFNITNAVVISPTSTNGNTEYYINSELTGDSTFFYNDTIQCSTSNCHITCDMNSGCNKLTVDASLSDTLIMECSNQSSCTYIEVTTSKINTQIICGDQQACSEGIIYGDSLTEYLSISCDSWLSCSGAQIHCPNNELSGCNIECKNSNSCGGTLFYVSDKFTKNLHLDCMQSGSCSSASVTCDDTLETTNLLYDATWSWWKCQTYDCCPVIFDTISCGSGSCNINCRSQRCANRYIDATLSTSLTIDCSVNNNIYGCFTSIIKCPQGEGTSCNIQCTQTNSCNSVEIQSGVNNKMSNFILDCSAYYGCRYADLKIQSNEITNVAIICEGGNSCRYLAVSISAIMGTFTFVCHDTQSCMFATGYKPYISSPSIDTMSWNCTRYGCQSADMTIDNTVIDSFSLFCPTDRPCSYIEIIAANSMINDLNIYCGGTDGNSYEHCINMNINVKIGRSANIICSSEEGCEGSHFYLYSQSKDVNININCINPLGSVPYYGACNAAYFYLYGYIENITNNVSIRCGQNDCRGADFITTDFNFITTNCFGNSSCDNVKIDAGNANLLNLKCDNQEACKGASIYCPYYDVSVCDINCSSLSMSCDNAHIHVGSSSYQYDYLNLICPSKGTCDSLDTICDNGGKTFNTMIYDNTSEYGYNGYVCPNWSEDICCPYFVNITTHTPTTAVPTSLTISPTTFNPTTTSPTTNNPTLNPSTSPTTATPTTSVPTTFDPTTFEPTTATPTTSAPTTFYPTTSEPTTATPTFVPTIPTEQTSNPTIQTTSILTTDSSHSTDIGHGNQGNEASTLILDTSKPWIWIIIFGGIILVLMLFILLYKWGSSRSEKQNKTMQIQMSYSPQSTDTKTDKTGEHKQTETTELADEIVQMVSVENAPNDEL